MSDQAWDLDFTNQTTEQADKDNAFMPDGWYRVKLVEVKDHQETGNKMLIFNVIYGALTGKRYTEFLTNPRFAAKPEFPKKILNCIAKRMGLVDASADGKTVTKAFGEAVGKEFVMKLHTQKYEGKEYQRFQFDLYPYTHDSLKADVLTSLGLTPGPNQTATTKESKGKAETPAASQPQAQAPKSPDAMAAMIW